MARVKSRLQRFAAKYASGDSVAYAGGRFDESKHKRAGDGKFTDGAGSPGKTSKPEPDDDIPFGEVVEDGSAPKPAYKPRAQTTANPKRPANAPKPGAKSSPEKPKEKPGAKPDQGGAASAENLKSAFHAALDGIGLIPGWGEAADLVNAAAYLADGKYAMAGLSLISMIPVIGDAIGKGGKALIHGGKYSGKVMAKIAPLVSKHWPRIKAALASAKELKPYAEPIDRAIQEVLAAHRQAKAAAPAPEAKKRPAARPKPKPAPEKHSKLERYARRAAYFGPIDGRDRIQQPIR